MSDSNLPNDRNKNRIRIAISTCPNDTFAFHAILNRKIDLRGLDFEFDLLDISELNRRLLSQQYDVVKASFHAALTVAADYWVLPSGSALGFGNGPLLLASKEATQPDSQKQLTLCPGEHTTATLLFRFFHDNTQIEQVVFSEIMPRLQQQRADFGVCIHEGRFTYRDSGLFLVEDLGTRWEQETECPLPLGGILARKDLGDTTTAQIQAVVRDSIQYGMANREETKATMQRYAQELNDDVLFQHVDLYVNQWTLDLGAEGQQAIEKLNGLAKRKFVNSSNWNGDEIKIFKRSMPL